MSRFGFKRIMGLIMLGLALGMGGRVQIERDTSQAAIATHIAPVPAAVQQAEQGVKSQGRFRLPEQEQS